MSEVIPIGPFHPALKEASHFELEVKGEKVVGGDLKFGYMHRGIEDLATKKLRPMVFFCPFLKLTASSTHHHDTTIY